ncbi:MAG TPA: EscU/YscU/HrcU family type III secretion system export apparatus switch protein [Pararobbsia sp.]|jgi:type III secretion protein U|nr:EscU/YscU/HrcU family type III secretion system export apparatus switch protein [Pararobbsia sp.]
MSEKTELPTEHKRREAAKKGQSFHARDLCEWLSLVTGIAWLSACTDWPALLEPLRHILASGVRGDAGALVRDCVSAAIAIIVPMLVVVVVVPAIVSLIGSRFELASQALVPDISHLDPIKGFGRIFSWRTLQQLACALGYCVATAVAVWIVVHVCGPDLFASVFLDSRNGSLAWLHLVVRPLAIALACMLPVCLLHAVWEMRLHTGDLKMEKREVTQEMRDHEGKPEVRARRRDLLLDMLDEQSRQDISGSKFVLANPTHLAVGIYVNEAVLAWPFVSIREANQRALAVIAYAESVGVPVIRNIRLARAVYRSSRRYSFVNDSVVDELMRVVSWLADVERARASDPSGGTHDDRTSDDVSSAGDAFSGDAPRRARAQ